MYLVFTRMPGESYRRRLRSLLLRLCDVFRVLITSLVCRFQRKREHTENVNPRQTSQPGHCAVHSVVETSHLDIVLWTVR